MYVGVTARAQGALGGPSPSNRWLHSDAKQAARQAQENGWFLWLSGWWFQTMVHFFYDSLSRYSLSRSFLVGGFKPKFYFPSHIWDVILPIDFHIFQDVLVTTNQLTYWAPKIRPETVHWRRSFLLKTPSFGWGDPQQDGMDEHPYPQRTGKIDHF